MSKEFYVENSIFSFFYNMALNDAIGQQAFEGKKLPMKGCKEAG